MDERTVDRDQGLLEKLGITTGAKGRRMDVTAWLQRLGLERYVPAFRDNDVDAEVLLELTADDLISIGVTSVGHRRKLLAAMATLRA
jgi:SAM domain (Sterile alpha motif)